MRFVPPQLCLLCALLGLMMVTILRLVKTSVVETNTTLGIETNNTNSEPQVDDHSNLEEDDSTQLQNSTVKPFWKLGPIRGIGLIAVLILVVIGCWFYCKADQAKPQKKKTSKKAASKRGSRLSRVATSVRLAISRSKVGKKKRKKKKKAKKSAVSQKSSMRTPSSDVPRRACVRTPSSVATSVSPQARIDPKEHPEQQVQSPSVKKKPTKLKTSKSRKRPPAGSDLHQPSLGSFLTEPMSPQNSMTTSPMFSPNDVARSLELHREQQVKPVANTRTFPSIVKKKKPTGKKRTTMTSSQDSMTSEEFLIWIDKKRKKPTKLMTSKSSKRQPASSELHWSSVGSFAQVVTSTSSQANISIDPKEHQEQQVQSPSVKKKTKKPTTLKTSKLSKRPPPNDVARSLELHREQQVKPVANTRTFPSIVKKKRPTAKKRTTMTSSQDSITSKDFLTAKPMY